MTDNPQTTPSAGSKEALEQGCTCPVIDNNHGEGVETMRGKYFWMNENCPIHKKGIIKDA